MSALTQLLSLPENEKAELFDALVEFLVSYTKKEQSSVEDSLENVENPWSLANDEKLLEDLKEYPVSKVTSDYGRSDGINRSRLKHIGMLDGGERVALDAPVLDVISSKSTKKYGKYELVSSLNPEDEPCFAELKKWRNQVARDLEWAPYMILDNKTLMSIAYYKPTTEDEMLQIKGIGPEKLGRYFGAITDIIKATKPGNYTRKMPTKPVEKTSSSSTGAKRFLRPNTLEYVPDEA